MVRPEAPDSFDRDNFDLRADLVKLLADNHLTVNHEIMTATCKNPTCKCLGFGVTKNGNQYKPNAKLVAAVEVIQTKYAFDSLNIWLPCKHYDHVCFARTYQNVLHNLIEGEDGQLEEFTTNNIFRPDTYTGPVPTVVN
jgi:hypothetical protein